MNITFSCDQSVINRSIRVYSTGKCHTVNIKNKKRKRVKNQLKNKNYEKNSNITSNN